MSVEDEKKKPRKAPAKKAATASSGEPTGEKKVKAAAAKSSPAKKSVAKAAPQETVEPQSAQQESVQPEALQQAPKPAATHREPSQAEIAERAHAYFVERGYQHGFHEIDWFRAENDLRGRRS